MSVDHLEEESSTHAEKKDFSAGRRPIDPWLIVDATARQLEVNWAFLEDHEDTIFDVAAIEEEAVEKDGHTTTPAERSEKVLNIQLLIVDLGIALFGMLALSSLVHAFVFSRDNNFEMGLSVIAAVVSYCLAWQES